MALTSKQMREIETYSIESSSEFDFGEPEIIEVEIAPGKFLPLGEPSAEDLMAIAKIESDKGKGGEDDIEITLKIICILHSPAAGQRKLTLKDAKRLRPKQIGALSEAVKVLVTFGDEEEEEKNDMKSDYEGES
jgi:hypothetical protein